MTVEAALRRLLATFDAIYAENGGLTDTEVREILARTVIDRLVDRKPTPIPGDFQMMVGSEMSPEYDARVGRALTEFITAVEAADEWRRCTTAAERKALIARDDVVSDGGNAYWLYLGDWS